MEKLKRFFWLCSGSNRDLLEQSKTEASKYAGIGATVFFTGMFAAVAAGFAIFSFSESWVAAISMGFLWGLMILNLDRYIVSSMRKTDDPKKEWKMAAPRIALALLIAVVISKPLELKIFEKEIETELFVMNEEINQANRNKVTASYAPSRQLIQQAINGLNQEVAEKEAVRNELDQIAQKEADGTGGSMKRNPGPIYKLKKADADKAQRELDILRAQNNARLKNYQAQLDSLDRTEAKALANLENADFTGLAARLDALSRLGDKSTSILMANWFIVLLFIAIEIAPVLVKLMSSRGPYDDLLAQEEHKYATGWLEHLAEQSARTRKKAEKLSNVEKDYVEQKLSARLS